MDFQELSELTISDGDVRTIHDSEGNLLWGKLSYDTSYQGDTTQASYSGKNLVNLPTITRSESGIDWTISDSIHAVGSGTADSSADSYLISGYKNIDFDITGDFTFSISSAINAPLYFRFYDSSSTNLGQLAIASGNTSVTGTIPSSAVKYRILLAPTNGTTYNIDIYLQLEKSSTPTQIEPYVGGIPSPNPDYPQSIKVVTGTQTITLSDGINSEDYTVNLGSTELCKIGTYQDYIYKSGDDWYVHKDIGKTILSSTTDWQVRTDATVANCTVFRDYDYVAGLFNSNAQGLSTHFTIASSYSANVIRFVNANQYGISPVLENDTLDITGSDNNGQKATKFKTWLSNNTVSVYYVLATPTDTQITDATLISQLEAIQQFLTRYGYSSSVSGNIPIIINQEAL